MGKPRVKPNYRRRVLRLPDLDHCKRSQHDYCSCDYHPSFLQIVFMDADTVGQQERRLEHREAAEKFYRDLGALSDIPVEVGCRACLGVVFRAMGSGQSTESRGASEIHSGAV
jgi:hypothetical protein